MKFLFSLLIVFTLFTGNLQAQDTIVLRSGKRIAAQVTEVGKGVVKYKEWNDLDGPNYTFDRSDIAWIQYENGKTEIYAEDMYEKYSNAQDRRSYRMRKTKAVVKDTSTKIATRLPQKIDTVPRKPRKIDSILRFDLGVIPLALAPASIGPGFGFSAALKVNISHTVTVGLQEELFFFFPAADSVQSNLPAILNTTIFGDYYLNDLGQIHPYLGLGIDLCAGVFMSTEDYAQISTYSYENTPQSYFSLGISPTAGFDYHKFSFSMTYNFLGSRTISFSEYTYTGGFNPNLTLTATKYGFYSTSFFELRAAYVFGKRLRPKGLATL